jgi:putative hydrolase of the HAD superfamily
MEPIRAVLFDAVGTLIYPSPAVRAVYAAVSRRLGGTLSEDEAEFRFRAAFAQQEERDAADGNRTDEARERERWRQIVAEVFADQPEPEEAFDELWDHFARSEAWACFPDVGPCLTALAERGLTVGVASNFDARLRSVVAGLDPLRTLTVSVISSEVGWRKPAPEFFAAACRLLKLSPAQVLLVGDDWGNDYLGGRQAGVSVALLARKRPPAGVPVFRTLDDIPALPVLNPS